MSTRLENARIGVLGAGMIGLCTAVQLQQLLPASNRITIIADKFNADTTSDGAAGLYRPTTALLPGVPRELLKQWCKDSFDYYDALANSKDAAEAGAGVISGYHFFIDQEKEEDPIYSEVVYNYRNCSDNEMKMFPHTENAHYAVNFTSVIVECRWFLPWMMKRFRNSGGIVEMRKVKNIKEVLGQFDVIVNCTGLGSIELFNDKVMKSSRGQMLRVYAPWIKHVGYFDNDCWIIPGRETVTIGGTRQVGDEEEELREEDRRRIWSKACRFVPSLKNATVAWEWVGFRPYRNPIRIEKEYLRIGQATLPVVHHYGHGGTGIAVGWGTAKHACQLVLEVLTDCAAKL